MKDLADKIRNKEYTCLIAEEEIIFSSGRFGVLPLIEFYQKQNRIDRQYKLRLADKLLGKGGALFIIEMNAFIEVFASVMTDEAYELLSDHGIKASYDQRVSHILNRTKTDLCPIEKIAKDATVEDFNVYYQNIISFYKQINQI